MKLCEFINEALKKIGVEKIFGIPGSLVMPIWQSISGPEIVLCSHEQEASYVATGYGKISKRPVAVITTGGPGVTNTVSGIASANIDSVPVIYISGRTPLSKNGKGLRQEESHVNRMFDSVDIFQNFTKKSIYVDNPETAAKEIWECILECVNGRCGAVHISIPIDLQTMEIPEQTVLNTERILSKKTCKESVDITIKNSPLIIMGWGCWMEDAVSNVYELAERMNAPILVTSKAYCCIRYKHPLFLGKLGYGYTRDLEEFCSEYKPDTILAFGTSLGEKDIPTYMWETFIQTNLYVFSNDISSYENKPISTEQIIEGNIKEQIVSLCDKVSRKKIDSSLLEKIWCTREKARLFWKSKIQKDDLMAQAIDLINQHTKSNVIITADAGNHLANAGALIENVNEGSFFLDVGIRAMGNGICMTVGMSIANPTKTFIAFTGDGCMLMNGNVMHLAKKRNLPIVFVVFNNHALGRVRVGQSIMNDYRATDIYDVDFQMYGKTYGLDTYQFISINEFENQIDAILAKGKTTLIELITGQDEIPVSVKDNVY